MKFKRFTLFAILSLALMTFILLVVILAAWWILWHTDTLFTNILGTLPDTAVAVRMLVPWPTAFVWISWGVTFWLLALIAVTFVPKVKSSFIFEDGL